MSLKSLFKKRTQLYYKNILRYFRYIFNDHFSLVLFFLIGAGGYAYSNYLAGLTKGDFQAQFVLLLLFFLISIRTGIKIIVEPADQVFLLAKEEEFYSIFKKELIKSYLQSSILTGIFVFLTFPVLRLAMGITTTESLLLFLALSSLKWMNLMVKIYPYFYRKTKRYQKYRIISQIVTFFALNALFFIQLKFFSIFLLIFASLTAFLFINEKIYFNHSLKWDVMIEAEEARLHRLYRFIALFIDIPQIDSGVNRLSFLDPLIEKLTLTYPKAPYYYSLRIVIRNAEYRSLILRLTFFAAFFLFLTNSYLLSFIFTVFFIYILGFQLISMVQMNKNMPQFKIAPVSEKNQEDSVIYLINQILILMTVILGIVGTINLGWIGLSLFPIGWLASYLFSHYYLTYRLKSNEI